eukprot:jgi/Astpho2/3457/fgenesh1_pg.00055_%23_21_t
MPAPASVADDAQLMLLPKGSTAAWVKVLCPTNIGSTGLTLLLRVCLAGLPSHPLRLHVAATHSLKLTCWAFPRAGGVASFGAEPFGAASGCPAKLHRLSVLAGGSQAKLPLQPGSNGCHQDNICMGTGLQAGCQLVSLSGSTSSTAVLALQKRGGARPHTVRAAACQAVIRQAVHQMFPFVCHILPLCLLLPQLQEDHRQESRVCSSTAGGLKELQQHRNVEPAAAQQVVTKAAATVG